MLSYLVKESMRESQHKLEPSWKYSRLTFHISTRESVSLIDTRLIQVRPSTPSSMVNLPFHLNMRSIRTDSRCRPALPDHLVPAVYLVSVDMPIRLGIQR